MSDVDLGKAYVVIREWSIVQVHSKESGLFEFFVGFSMTDDIGRMSTVIQTFDTTYRLGVTKSGSMYSLVGKPTLPHDIAIYVLQSKLGAERVQKELFSSEGTEFMTFKYPIK